MTLTSKLRVSIPDATRALGAVTTDVHEATGYIAHPVFQEIERGDLIVEMSLPNTGDRPPHEVAKVVAESVPAVEVLSTWKETEVPPAACPASAVGVVSLSETVVPDLARRAVDDQLPTAKWHPRTEHDVSHWDLAVPVFAKRRPIIAGIRRRNGSAVRFTALEADAVARTLAS